MQEPIVESAAGFAGRRHMVQYLEQELTNQLHTAELGLPVNEDRPTPVLGAFLIAGIVWIQRQMQKWADLHAADRRLAVPRIFYGGHS